MCERYDDLEPEVSGQDRKRRPSTRDAWMRAIVVAPALVITSNVRVFGLLRADAFAARMAAGAILFFGSFPPRLAAGMFIGAGILFMGMGSLLLLGALEQSSVPGLLPLSVVVLCLGALLVGFGLTWFRRAGPPGRELAKGVP